VIVGSNANEMTSLTAPDLVPKTMQAYRARVQSQYGEATTEFDVVYPAKDETDIASAYLGNLRDVAFTLQMRTWARMISNGRSKAYLYFGDTVQLRNHLRKDQLDFIEQFQKRTVR